MDTLPDLPFQSGYVFDNLMSLCIPQDKIIAITVKFPNYIYEGIDRKGIISIGNRSFFMSDISHPLFLPLDQFRSLLPQ